MDDGIFINDKITIPGAELTFIASRSSGPGGQHVNKTDSRIQVRWNLENSTVLSIYQRNTLRRSLQARLTDSGDILLASDVHRSQRRNREEVCQRLAALIRENIVPPKPRKKTKPTKASKQRRLDEKKKRSRLKKGRSGEDY